MGKCVNCSCTDFKPNPFKTQYCLECLHNHLQVANVALSAPDATSSSASSPSIKAGSPALPPKPSPISSAKPATPSPGLKPTTTAPPPNFAAPSRPAGPVRTSSATSMGPPLPPKPTKFASPTLSSTSSPAPTTTAPGFNKSASSSSLPRTTAQTQGRPGQTSAAPAVPSKPTPSSLSASQPVPRTPSPALTTQKSTKTGFFSKMKAALFDSNEEDDDDIPFEIGAPTAVRHETHIGIREDGNFETKNLPPDLKVLFDSLNTTLRNMGAKGITKEEAKYLLTQVLANDKNLTAKLGAVKITDAPAARPSRPAPIPTTTAAALAGVTKAPPVPPKPTTSSAANTTPSATPSNPRPINGAKPTPAPTTATTTTTKPVPATPNTAANNALTTNLQQQVSSLQQQVSSLQQQLRTQETKASRLEDDAKKSNTKVDDLNKKLADAEKAKMKLEVDLREQTLRVGVAQSSGGENATAIKKKFDAELKDMKTKFDSDSSAMERKHKDEMMALRTKLDAESAARNEAESAKDVLSQEIDTLRLSSVQSDKKDEALQEMQIRMRQTHDAEMSKTKARHQEELAKMTARADEEAQTAKASEARRRAAELELKEAIAKIDMVGQEAAQTADVRSLLEGEIKALKAKFDQDIADAESKAQRSAQDSRGGLEREITNEREARIEAERVAAEREARIQALEADLARERDAREAAQARLAEVGSAPAEEEESGPVVAVPPPMAPPPPPMMPKKTASAGITITKSATPREIPPPQQDNHSDLLKAIRSPDKVLKHVRKSQLIKEPVDFTDTDPTNIVGILAKALIQRRGEMQEDEDNEEEPEWDE
eukprot:TRINITY_DN7303_c0_g1_i7.p1 TRINITY_DN7303_c0_g1~~TRINITY_DN7303_c0_g1_i7.p1  ORF type:complete len:829 (-),score=279.03 TRINITY_DN7303_c0_g1_i7:1315-3801(-)